MERALKDHCSKIGNEERKKRRINDQAEDGLQVIDSNPIAFAHLHSVSN